MSLTDTLTRRLSSAPAVVYAAPPQVNLLPTPERERRERDALVRRWLAVAAGAVVLVLLLTLATMLKEHAAGSALSREQQRTLTLAQELSTYQDVARATHDKGAYQAYRTQAMADDLVWSGVIGALQAALPDGAHVTGFDAVVGKGDSADQAEGGLSGQVGQSGATGTDPITIPRPSGTVVTVIIQVTSMQPLDQKAMVASFRKVPGVLGVDMASLSSASSVSYSSTTGVFFDDSVLSGKYAKATR